MHAKKNGLMVVLGFICGLLLSSFISQTLKLTFAESFFSNVYCKQLSYKQTLRQRVKDTSSQPGYITHQTTTIFSGKFNFSIPTKSSSEATIVNASDNHHSGTEVALKKTIDPKNETQSTKDHASKTVQEFVGLEHKLMSSKGSGFNRITGESCK